MSTTLSKRSIDTLLGIALSISFSSKDAAPLPLVLVGILIFAFLGFEARRAIATSMCGVRARWIETHFYAPMLRGEGISTSDNWQAVLAADYCEPVYHISYVRALGRRLRRNYAWIFAIQAIAYYGKIAVHPTPIATWEHLWERTAVGPLLGELMVVCGALFYGGLVALAVSAQTISPAGVRARLPSRCARRFRPRSRHSCS